MLSSEELMEIERFVRVLSDLSGDYSEVMRDELLAASRGIASLLDEVCQIYSVCIGLRCCGNCGRLYLCQPNDGTSTCDTWEARNAD